MELDLCLHQTTNVFDFLPRIQQPMSNRIKKNLNTYLIPYLCINFKLKFNYYKNKTSKGKKMTYLNTVQCISDSSVLVVHSKLLTSKYL